MKRQTIVFLIVLLGFELHAQDGGLLEAYEEAQKQYEVFDNCGSGLDGYMATLRTLENSVVDASVTLTAEEESEMGRMMRQEISTQYTFVKSALFENALSQMLTTELLQPYVKKGYHVYANNH
jgi:hypothetical protein